MTKVVAKTHMRTLSGRLLSVDDFAPTPEDAALHLGRIFRWAGAVVCPWTVIHHSVYVEASAELEGHSPEVRLHALIHDVQEIVTGDMPSPIKARIRSAKETQNELDALLWKAWGIPEPSAKVKEAVHKIDKRAMAVEAWMVAVPYKDRPELAGQFGHPPAKEEKEIVDKISGIPSMTWNDSVPPLATLFLVRLRLLQMMVCRNSPRT